MLPVHKQKGLLFRIAMIAVMLSSNVLGQTHLDAENPPKIIELIGDQPMTRVGRPFVVLATIENPSQATAQFKVHLNLPRPIEMIKNNARELSLAPGEKRTLRWTITAQNPLYEEVRIILTDGSAIVASQSLPVRFLPAMKRTNPPYIPEPKPVSNKEILVGAHNCPLWEADQPEMWDQVLYKHPERTPALGFYAQENPEVADWETKWAVEHGVDFFIYCWYRASEGGPVEQHHGSAIHDAFFKSRFQNKIKFTIMWENQGKDSSGVTDEDDLLNNLLPFWIVNYFKHPSYLKVDNKPLLFIYVPGPMWGPKRNSLLEDLGSVENVRRALNKMREACRMEGFDGLTILGECRKVDADYLQLMKDMGFDYSFAYCWHIPNSPTPQQAIDAQMEYLRKTQELGILPQVCTLSQAWSGWRDEGTIWKIPPIEYETFLRQAKAFIRKLPQDQLGSQMVILDNWNEWSEGHYLLPYTEYGFGYLDAIRRVFTDAPAKHIDLIPEDVGRGGYERAFREHLAKKRAEEY